MARLHSLAPARLARYNDHPDALESARYTKLPVNTAHGSQSRGYTEGGAVGHRALPKEALAGGTLYKKECFYQTNPTEKCGSVLK